MPNAASTSGWLGFVLIAVALSTGPAEAAGDKSLGEYLSSQCSTCHQSSGLRVGGIPVIIGYRADQFSALMRSYKAKERDNEIMQTIVARLTPDEIEALAAYYEGLKPP